MEKGKHHSCFQKGRATECLLCVWEGHGQNHSKGKLCLTRLVALCEGVTALLNREIQLRRLSKLLHSPILDLHLERHGLEG